MMGSSFTSELALDGSSALVPPMADRGKTRVVGWLVAYSATSCERAVLLARQAVVGSAACERAISR
jgi:hypothetical protein